MASARTLKRANEHMQGDGLAGEKGIVTGDVGFEKVGGTSTQLYLAEANDFAAKAARIAGHRGRPEVVAQSLIIGEQIALQRVARDAGGAILCGVVPVQRRKARKKVLGSL